MQNWTYRIAKRLRIVKVILENQIIFLSFLIKKSSYRNCLNLAEPSIQSVTISLDNFRKIKIVHINPVSSPSKQLQFEVFSWHLQQFEQKHSDVFLPSIRNLIRMLICIFKLLYKQLKFLPIVGCHRITVCNMMQYDQQKLYNFRMILSKLLNNIRIKINCLQWYQIGMDNFNRAKIVSRNILNLNFTLILFYLLLFSML